jgi:predicted 3-demethylubiquinone-9 3-methyltransferase (glyoxalase superfamily)
MLKTSGITPCLWFDSEGEEAARFYTGIFPNSRITAISRYPAVGQELHGQPAGKVMTVGFELDGTPFTALNGGPAFKFNQAISMQVFCDTQDEIDRYWHLLGEGGGGTPVECGWVTDRYGLSWQIVPGIMPELLTGDPKRAERAFAAMLTMKKFDIETLRQAVAG